ncbi:hypothetical protein [Haloplanus halophilus]|uniref:hypothetical protein n=1 Tax=Haloplanus halophilus TaxID=2949993 RepID=UPI00204199B7|nr:hypothetical protein [Haloplanus sp. GDY1]
MSNIFQVKLGPTFGEDVARIRGRSCALPTQGEYTPIFEFTIPLELHTSPVQFDQNDIPYVRFTANPEDYHINNSTVAPDTVISDRLLQGGTIATSVDSLSRSFVHQPASETALLRTLEQEPTVSASVLEEIRRQLVTPLLSDDLSQTQARSARELLSQNIRTHEAQHLRDLIDPRTAMWKETELLWQFQLIAASSHALNNESIVKRIAVLYAIPRQFLTELSALVTEELETEDPEVESVITKRVSEQRGPEQRLLDYFNQYNLSSGQLTSILDCDAAEQYGDIWILYVLKQLNQGRLIDNITSKSFLEEMDIQSPAQYMGIKNMPDSELSALRDDFIDLVFAHLYGPAFEVISFDTSNTGEFEIRRQWFNTNPTVDGDGHLLAVRRALFLRTFMSEFRSLTELTALRTEVKKKISRTLSGNTVSLSPPLFEIDPERVADNLRKSLRNTGEELIDTPERKHLAQWLNDLNYVPSAHS